MLSVVSLVRVVIQKKTMNSAPWGWPGGSVAGMEAGEPSA